MSTDIATLGMAVDSTKVVEGTKNLDAMAESAQKAGKAVDQMGRESHDAFEGFGADSTELHNAIMSNMVKPLLAVIGVIGTLATAMSVLGHHSVEVADNMKDMATGTGRSIEELQILQVIAEKNGSSLEKINGTLNFVAKGMSKVGDESNKYGRALEYFGVTLEKNDGTMKTQAELAYDIAKAYEESEKTASTAAAAQVALGSGYEKAIPSLLELNKAEEEKNKLRLYGAVIDKNLAEASDNYNDTLRDLKSISLGIGNDMARMFLPLFQGVAEAFINSYTHGGILAGVINLMKAGFEVLAWTLKALVTVVITLDASLQMVGKTLGAILATITNPSNARTIWQEWKRDIDEIAKDSEKSLDSLWKNIEKVNDAPKEVINRGGFYGGRIKKEKEDLADYAKELLALNTVLKNNEEATRGVANEHKEFDKAYAKVQADLEAGKKVTWEQINAYYELAEKADASTAALKKLNEETKAMIQYAKDEQKAIDDAKKAITQMYDTVQKMIVVAQQNNQKLIDEINLLGLTKEEQIRMNYEYEKRNILLGDGDPKQKQNLINLAKEKELLLLQKEAIQQSNAAWKDFIDAAVNSTKQFIGDWLEGGLSKAMKNLWGRFKQWAFDAFADIMAKQVVVSLVGAFTTGTAGASGGIPGLGGGGGALGSLGNLGSLGSLASTISSLPTLVGTFAGYMADGVGIMGAFNSALTAAGLSMTSLIPVVGAIAAAGFMIYNFVKSKGGGPKEGGFATTGLTPGITGVDNSGRWMTPNNKDADMFKAVNAINTNYQLLLAALGGKGSAVFAQGFSTDPKGKAPSNVHTGVWVNGQQVFDQPNGNVGRSNEELQAELERQSMQAVLAALQNSELPGYIKRYLATIDASTADSATIQAALTKAAELKKIGDDVAKLPEFLSEGLLDALGKSDEIDAKIKKFAADFKEFWDTAGELGDAIARDPVKEASKAFADANRTVYEKVYATRDALAATLAAYDGTAAGNRKLTDAMNDFRDAQVAALMQIKEFSKELKGMFADTREQFALALMTPDQKEQYYAQQAIQNLELLKQTTDPAKIRELSQIINQDLVNALGLLDPVAQKAEYDRLKAILDAADAAAQAQLTAAENLVESTGEDLVSQIHIAVQGAADKMFDAAQQLIDAANAIQGAANTQVDAATDQKDASAIMLDAANTMQAATSTPIDVNVTVRNEAGSTVNG